MEIKLNVAPSIQNKTHKVGQVCICANVRVHLVVHAHDWSI